MSHLLQTYFLCGQSWAEVRESSHHQGSYIPIFSSRIPIAFLLIRPV